MEFYCFTKAALVFALGLGVQGLKFIPKPAQPRCPDPAGKIGVCAELCYSDGDCPYGQKCCFNGCGHQCMATTPGEILDKETNYTAASPKSVFVLQ
ncbi:hypothetical protein AMECASPLE_027337 [Ameca splendens]|uniref:WAP domain-containing protein n=1 Tax=Ameca splendens TaxID=208324 RepID=A0ABV0XUE7_9TELE